MDTEVVQKNASNGELTEQQINTLYQAGVIPKDTPKSQIMVFANVCKEKGLSPFSKEIYLVGYKNRYSVIVGIDGFRKQAALTNLHAGTDDVKFDLQQNGDYKTAAQLSQNKELPTSATVTIYKIVGGQRVGFTHTALFKEFSNGMQKWKTMPFQMLAKVAESFALRKGFPAQLAGLSIPEEKVAYENRQGEEEKPKAKIVLTKDHKHFKNVIKAIESGEHDSNGMKEFYDISDELLKELKTHEPN